MDSEMLASTRSPEHRKFWTDFLLLYKNLPALWNMRCNEYKDRCAKVKAYDILANKLSLNMPNASRHDVLKRINIFRTNYRRERARIQLKQRHGMDSQTSLWYFHLLTFLDTQETRVRTRRHNKSKFKEDQCTNNEHEIGDQTPYNPEDYVVYESVEDIASDSIGLPHKRKKLNSYEFFDEISQNNESIEGDEEIQNNGDGYFVENDDIGETHNFTMKTQNYIKNRDKNDAYSIVNEYNEQSQENSICDEVLSDYETESQQQLIDDCIISDENDNSQQNDLPINNVIVDNGAEDENSKSNRNIIRYKSEDVKSKILSSKYYQPISSIDSNRIRNAHISSAGEILARSWAIQYDEMCEEQKVYARKAIADILFAGCLGKLKTVQKTTEGGSDNAITEEHPINDQFNIICDGN